MVPVMSSLEILVEAISVTALRLEKVNKPLFYQNIFLSLKYFLAPDPAAALQLPRPGPQHELAARSPRHQEISG